MAATSQIPWDQKNNPVKLYFNPIEETGEINLKSKEFLKFLEKETGLFFRTGITSSYIALVEALVRQELILQEYLLMVTFSRMKSLELRQN